MNQTLGLLLFLLNPPPAPPPEDNPPAQSEDQLSAEEAAEYEARYNSCAGTWDPDGCRADLYEEYYG